MPLFSPSRANDKRDNRRRGKNTNTYQDEEEEQENNDGNISDASSRSHRSVSSFGSKKSRHSYASSSSSSHKKRSTVRREEPDGRTIFTRVVDSYEMAEDYNSPSVTSRDNIIDDNVNSMPNYSNGQLLNFGDDVDDSESDGFREHASDTTSSKSSLRGKSLSSSSVHSKSSYRHHPDNSLSQQHLSSHSRSVTNGVANLGDQNVISRANRNNRNTVYQSIVSDILGPPKLPKPVSRKGKRSRSDASSSGALYDETRSQTSSTSHMVNSIVNGMGSNSVSGDQSNQFGEIDENRVIVMSRREFNEKKTKFDNFFKEITEGVYMFKTRNGLEDIRNIPGEFEDNASVPFYERNNDEVAMASERINAQKELNALMTMESNGAPSKNQRPSPEHVAQLDENHVAKHQYSVNVWQLQSMKLAVNCKSFIASIIAKNNHENLITSGVTPMDGDVTSEAIRLASQGHISLELIRKTFASYSEDISSTANEIIARCGRLMTKSQKSALHAKHSYLQRIISNVVMNASMIFSILRCSSMPTLISYDYFEELNHESRAKNKNGQLYNWLCYIKEKLFALNYRRGQKENFFHKQFINDRGMETRYWHQFKCFKDVIDEILMTEDAVKKTVYHELWTTEKDRCLRVIEDVDKGTIPVVEPNRYFYAFKNGWLDIGTIDRRMRFFSIKSKKMLDIVNNSPEYSFAYLYIDRDFPDHAFSKEDGYYNFDEKNLPHVNADGTVDWIEEKMPPKHWSRESKQIPIVKEMSKHQRWDFHTYVNYLFMGGRSHRPANDGIQLHLMHLGPPGCGKSTANIIHSKTHPDYNVKNIPCVNEKVFGLQDLIDDTKEKFVKHFGLVMDMNGKFDLDPTTLNSIISQEWVTVSVKGGKQRSAICDMIWIWAANNFFIDQPIPKLRRFWVFPMDYPPNESHSGDKDITESDIMDAMPYFIYHCNVVFHEFNELKKRYASFAKNVAGMNIWNFASPLLHKQRRRLASEINFVCGYIASDWFEPDLTFSNPISLHSLRSLATHYKTDRDRFGNATISPSIKQIKEAIKAVYPKCFIVEASSPAALSGGDSNAPADNHVVIDDDLDDDIQSFIDEEQSHTSNINVTSVVSSQIKDKSKGFPPSGNILNSMDVETFSIGSSSDFGMDDYDEEDDPCDKKQSSSNTMDDCFTHHPKRQKTLENNNNQSIHTFRPMPSISKAIICPQLKDEVRGVGEVIYGLKFSDMKMKSILEYWKLIEQHDAKGASVVNHAVTSLLPNVSSTNSFHDNNNNIVSNTFKVPMLPKNGPGPRRRI